MSKTLPACIAVCVLLTAVAMAGQTAPDSPLHLQYLKKAVDFSHASHAALECRTCHHPWDGTGPMPKCSQSGCHDVFDAKDKSAQSFYKIVHGPSTDTAPSCLGCHKDAAAAAPEQKKALTGCVGSACHPS